MLNVTYGNGTDTTPEELGDFYHRLRHPTDALPDKITRMMANSAVFVTARVEGRLIGIARGVCDGVRGYLTECKLDPLYQGEGAVTRTDGRIEHDSYGVAAEMGRRVLEKLRTDGVERIDVVAWGTEVDFLAELGFKKQGGLVGMTLRAGDGAKGGAVTAAQAATK